MYLHAILELSHYGAFGDEREETALHLVRHWDDEGDEDGHLEDQKAEDLGFWSVKLLVIVHSFSQGRTGA